MRFVVGLGNPGERYRRTRHNLGFMVVDEILARTGGGPGQIEGEAWTHSAGLAGQDVLLVKSLSFMNRSGVAVARILEERGATPQDLVVVVDDIAIGFGEVRVRERGGHGGHNGLRSLVDLLGTEDFPRIRLGIGLEDPPPDLAAYVLSDFPEDDILMVQELVGRGADTVECFIREGAGVTMSRFNGPRRD